MILADVDTDREGRRVLHLFRVLGLSSRPQRPGICSGHEKKRGVVTFKRGPQRPASSRPAPSRRRRDANAPVTIQSGRAGPKKNHKISIFSLPICPSIGLVDQGVVIAPRSASLSRSRPAANFASGVAAAAASLQRLARAPSHKAGKARRDGHALRQIGCLHPQAIEETAIVRDECARGLLQKPRRPVDRRGPSSRRARRAGRGVHHVRARAAPPHPSIPHHPRTDVGARADQPAGELGSVAAAGLPARLEMIAVGGQGFPARCGVAARRAARPGAARPALSCDRDPEPEPCRPPRRRPRTAA